MRVPNPATVIKVIGVYSSILIIVVLFLNVFGDNEYSRALTLMGTGLVLVWCVGFGLITLRFRDRIHSFLSKFSIVWWVGFILFAAVLSLIEEFIAVTMTNLAPYFGVGLGEIMMTASTNYFEVIFQNSVFPLFIPWFIAWAFLIARYSFTPSQAFLLFGFTGVLAEVQVNLQAVVSGFWIFVYGLMIYLPVYVFSPVKERIKPRWYHFILAFALPFVFLLPWSLLYGAVLSNFGLEYISSSAVIELQNSLIIE